PKSSSQKTKRPEEGNAAASLWSIGALTGFSCERAAPARNYSVLFPGAFRQGGGPAWFAILASSLVSNPIPHAPRLSRGGCCCGSAASAASRGRPAQPVRWRFPLLSRLAAVRDL